MEEGTSQFEIGVGDGTIGVGRCDKLVDNVGRPAKASY